MYVRSIHTACHVSFGFNTTIGASGFKTYRKSSVSISQPSLSNTNLSESLAHTSNFLHTTQNAA